MRTLFVTPWSPYPLIFGGAIRMYHMIRMLSSSDITLVTYRSWSDEDPLPHLQTICRDVTIIDAKRDSTFAHRSRSLVSRHSHQYLAHQTDAMQRRIDELAVANNFDVVLVEMTPMGAFRLPDRALRILDMPNIEHELVERRAAVASNPLRRAALGWEGRKVRREELDITHRFDLLLTTSDRENQIVRSWGGEARVETIPNAVDSAYFSAAAARSAGGHRIAFIGTTHVDANRDGLRHFMAEIFPLIEQQLPDVELTIVGGDPPADIRVFDQLPNVRVTGYVKDVRDYMATADALIVPLRSGGGTRLKILEGLSFGVPTISTTIGAEGLSLVNGEHIMIADDPRQFADATVSVLTDTDLSGRLSTAGRAFVEREYDWEAVGCRMRDLIDEALADKRSQLA